jgi:hypothetical protein
MEKRKDTCLFCNSRKCYERVVSSKDSGQTYDEVACYKHIKDLHKHSDEIAPKVMKWFISSTGIVKRKELFHA